MDDRSQRYQVLVDARKACRLCSGSGLINASAVRGGVFDTDHMSPWTASLGDLDARIMVIGQDWGDQRAFEKQAGHDWLSSATNRMLRTLMASAGINVPDTDRGGTSGVFLTNAVLCFRTAGGCQGPVQSQWFQNCGSRFLRPQIELVNPEAVVCLGQRAHGAVLAAYGLPPVRDWRAAVEGSGVALPGGPLAYAVYHCGQRILNTHRNESAQLRDWQRVGTMMARASARRIRVGHETEG
jgi:DNA polymerase